MKIEVYGEHIWVYEIDPGCARVLVNQGGTEKHDKKCWGFLPDGRHVEGELIEYHETYALIG